MARVDPRYAYPQPAGFTTYRPEYHGMQNMAPQAVPPPPVYDPNRPPMYSGPDGATKVAPSQWGNEPTHRPQGHDYEAPPGPPPAVTADQTGSSNNPYRP